MSKWRKEWALLQLERERINKFLREHPRGVRGWLGRLALKYNKAATELVEQAMQEGLE